MKTKTILLTSLCVAALVSACGKKAAEKVETAPVAPATSIEKMENIPCQGP